MSMNDLIKGRLSVIPGSDARYNQLREFLQALVLKFIEEKNYSKNMAFVGGTALRFLYGIGRFSEDLDFSQTSAGGFDFNVFLEELVKHFFSMGIVLEAKPKSVKTVMSSFLKFPDIMHENGISVQKGQKLFVKFEIDSDPPEGFNTEVSFIQHIRPMNVLHYDISSLFAGKLHAVLLRSYTKGRDIFDLLWFLGRKTRPNYTQLENAIYQTTGEKLELDDKKLASMLQTRLSEFDWKKAVDEVRVFIENKDELQYLTRENVEKAVLKCFESKETY